jgi:type VII secretion integral membrane protein EccD
VLSEGRRLDVAVAGTIPLVEVVPGFARSLGVLDPTLVHAGYALRRADGSTLDVSLSATAQGIHDGDVLTLVRGVQLAEPRVYDDVTEAVLDAASENHQPWTPRDNTRTALAVSLTFLTLCAVLLVSAGPDFGWGAVIAGSGAVLLLAAAAVLGRLGQTESGIAFGLAAAAFAGLGAFLSIDSGTQWGWPLAAAGLAIAIVGATALILAPAKREINVAPIAMGVIIGVPALVTGLAPGAAVSAYVVMVALAGAIGNLLPWLALSSTRIKVISPQSDQEVFANPGPIDAAQVKERVIAGARILTALRLAVGASILVATPLVAGDSAAGAVLTVLAFIGMMFQSRQAYARSAVAVLMALGAVGLAVSGLTVTATQPDLRTELLAVLLAATGALVLLTLLSPRARLRLARVADTVEVLALAALLPLGVIAAGWI